MRVLSVECCSHLFRISVSLLHSNKATVLRPLQREPAAFRLFTRVGDGVLEDVNLTNVQKTNKKLMLFSAMILHCKADCKPRTTWAIEINFVMNHAPGAGLIALPVDQ